MLQSLFRGQFIIMHSLQELAHNRPIITMEHFLEQVAWPEAQLPLVRPNEAAPPEPTLVQVDPELADPFSPVVNPLSFPEREVVPPSPPLIIISDASSDEATAPPDSPVGETTDLLTSLVGGIFDSSSGEGERKDGCSGQYDQICNAQLPRALDPHSVPSEELSTSLE
ncbi:hypothetical protein JHK86_040243 [Glycine max]|nr:hypothetical protein JHK86_040243 [Glycine max]